MKFSDKLHNELGDNTLTLSDLHFLNNLIPCRFHYIDCHQRLFSLLLWPSYRPNQSRNIRSSTHILLLWGFRIRSAVVYFHIWFVVCLPVIIAVIWIIQVPIPVNPIFSVWDAFRWTILITFGRISFVSAFMSITATFSSVCAYE